MKLNWGSGIAAVYILFMIGVLIMVFIFMNQDVTLETDNYYIQGLQHQEQIDKETRTNELPEQTVIKQENGFIVIKFPGIFNNKDITGTVNFYRPSDNSKDFSFPVQTDSSNAQLIPSSNLEKGLWKIKINWNVKEISYYNEKILMVN